MEFGRDRGDDAGEEAVGGFRAGPGHGGERVVAGGADVLVARASPAWEAHRGALAVGGEGGEGAAGGVRVDGLDPVLESAAVEELGLDDLGREVHRVEVAGLPEGGGEG